MRMLSKRFKQLHILLNATIATTKIGNILFDYFTLIIIIYIAEKLFILALKIQKRQIKNPELTLFILTSGKSVS